jgi:histidine phosphotransferase ChpT
MSGSSIGALDFAALLCSRVCHDLISPVGAIVNGLEVLEEETDEETKHFALDLIKTSAIRASAKLQFCRMAFGAAGAAESKIDVSDAEQIARNLLEDEKTKLEWHLPPLFLPKNRVKLLLNLLLIASQSIPRGGRLIIEPVGEGETMGFKVGAKGINARIPPNASLLSDDTAPENLDAHRVQSFYTALLAKDCGLRAMVTMENETVIVSVQ